MFELVKEFKFEAAHMLPHHDGKCRRLHGHSWTLKVHLTGNVLETAGPKQGMLIDYTAVSTVVKPLLESSLDHHYLNETTGLENPTSECLAVWIFNKLQPHLPFLLSAVEICETCTSACIYRPYPESK